MYIYVPLFLFIRIFTRNKLRNVIQLHELNLHIKLYVKYKKKYRNLVE